MADASFQIGLEALYDNTDLEAGTTASATSLNELAIQADAAATKIETSFAGVDTGLQDSFGPSGTIPATVESGAVNLTTKASKFKAVGADLGGTLADGIAGGVSSGDAIGAVSSSVSGAAGLLAVTAGTAGGAAAAIGLGLGTSLVSSIVSGINKSKEAFDAKVKGLMEGAEVAVDASAKQIQRSIFEAFTVEAAIDEVGGFDKVQQLMDDTGLGFNEIADVIRGRVNPATKDTLDILNDIHDATIKAGDVPGAIVDYKANNAALDLLDIYGQQVDAQKVSADQKEKLLHYDLQQKSTQKELAAAEKEANAAAAQAARDQRQADQEHKAAIVDTLRNKKEVLKTIEDELANTDDLTAKEQDRLEARATLLEKQLAGLAADREAIALASQYAAQLERAASAAARIATNVLNGGKGGYF